MTAAETCLLCGHTDHAVVYQMVRWKEAHEGTVFGTIYRCRDRAACYRRVEENGGQWEVEDGRKP